MILSDEKGNAFNVEICLESEHEPTELKSLGNTLYAKVCKLSAEMKVANTFNRKLLDDKKELQSQINKAISCVHDSHEDDMGYDVLCSLGENP